MRSQDYKFLNPESQD